MITKEADVFSVIDSDNGYITSNQMEIKQQDKAPVQLIYHSFPKLPYAELKAHVENLYNKGWIINSSSSYPLAVASMIKKDGLLCLCCDYCQVKRKTIPDRHLLPKIQNILEHLGGTQYFSILGQRKAYHQIHISPQSRYLTAFIIPWSFYKWVRVPFSLMNAPIVFQRFMKPTFQDYRDRFLVTYLDDLLVFSSDFNSHLKHLQLTIQSLRKYGLKIKAKKCQLFRRQVQYLGRIVAADGYRLNSNNIKAAKDLVRQKPKTLLDVRRLLGMVGYFRKHIPNFSKTSESLYVLLKKSDGQNNLSKSLSWSETQQEALDQFL